LAGAPKTEVAVDALTGVAGHTDSQRGERRIREEEVEERRGEEVRARGERRI
jgi:hypothetical protein